MEIDAVDKLVLHVIEKVAEDKSNLDEVVEFVISFSREHALSPDTLLKLSFIFGNDKMYREKYIISRASALLFSGKMREDAHMEAGKTASLLGLGDPAAREFKEILKENPGNVEASADMEPYLLESGNWIMQEFSMRKLLSFTLTMWIRSATMAACFTGSVNWISQKKLTKKSSSP